MNQDEDEEGRPAKEPPLFAPDVTFIQCPRDAKQLRGTRFQVKRGATRCDSDRPRYAITLPSADARLILVFLVDAYRPIPIVEGAAVSEFRHRLGAGRGPGGRDRP